MKVKGYRYTLYTLGIGIAVLLFASQLVALAEDAEDKKSPIKVGGAMRVNYAYGSYGTEENPHRRGEKIGDVDLEIFRLNADIKHDDISGRLEYRWYDGYSMIHTAWLGYNLGDLGTVKAGIVRAPFGPTAYGVSSSWFFDQHFYVGLADDMDLGITWSDTFGTLALDAGYFLTSEFQTDGTSIASSRYTYDIVPWEEKADADGTVEWGAGENGYEEQHQINLRGIYSIGKTADVGVSIQYGLLKAAEGMDDDGANHYALSAHMKNVFSDFTLFSQFSYYAHNIAEETPWGTGDLIPMGGYDFAWPIASTGLVPGLSLRYGGIDASGISWVNSVTPYIEWSSIMKSVENFNNSTLITLGASWTVLGALYVYSDLALSNGNFFVGNDGDVYDNILTGVGDFGANGNNSWNWRANLNFGYYF